MLRLAQMQQGATIITPNNRISHQLLEMFYQHQSEAVLEKPICLPYQAFLHHLMQRIRHQHAHLEHPIVLNTVQQYRLWQKILEAELDSPVSFGLIQAVQDAWTRCALWQIDVRQIEWMQTEQTRQFQSWHEAFTDELRQRHAITTEQIVPYVIPFLIHWPPKPLVWTCFNEFTPQQTALQNAFKEQGCEHIDHDLSSTGKISQQFAAKDRQDEYLHMITWLQQQRQEGRQRIGVVVPDLQDQSHSLQRLLGRYLPQAQFEISLGEPLANYPIIAHALAWIHLNRHTLTHETAQLILSSPYLKGARQEFLARAQHLQDSRLLQEDCMPFEAFLNQLPLNTAALTHLLQTFPDYPREATPIEWHAEFKQRLAALGFPGDASLNSADYQCLQRLMTLFDEFLQFSVVDAIMTQSQALSALSLLAQTTVFQLKKTRAPIQISGLLEAAGCQFDALWVCGLTDECLPQKINLSAFIPIELQRRYKMPHATPEHELKFAQLLLTRLSHGSENTIFSYPELTGDSPNLPSPLIRTMPHYQANRPELHPEANALISFEESYQIPAAKNEHITGGTSILANQAKCPFRAFAKHRLHAKSESNVSTGPNPLERGQVIHQIMETLWQTIRTQDNLLKLTETELDLIIQKSIAEALKPIKKHRIYSFPSLIETIETDRLKKLVNACLDWEKQRPPFKVQEIEQAYTLTLAGLEFQVRVDRVDAVAEGQWMIDYKSTVPAIKPWNQARPEEPQLLLYALLGHDIQAILFIQLKNGRILCSGFSEIASEINGIQSIKNGEQWSDYLRRWHHQLTQLAEEFQSGSCAPKPVRTTICQTCDFPFLCRKQSN